MADVIHIIDGQDRGVPANWQELELTVDWLTTKEPGGTPNLTNLVFNAEACKYLNERFLNGLNGGVGIFEGVPYQMKVGRIGNPAFIFEGYLDGTDELTFLGKEEITVGLKKRKGEDWLNDVADSFSFAYLADEGIITSSDYVKIPYVINYVPDGTQLILLSISIYMITKELIENVQKIGETIADVTDASVPVQGVGVGANAGGPIITVNTGFDLGNFILVVLKALARIVYIIAITVAIINLIESLFEQLLPKKRDHLGMTERRMFERACQHLGLQFQSSIIDLDTVHIPRKDRQGGESGESGHPTNSGPIYLFGDFIRTMKEKYNADYRITNNIFYFERRDQFEIPSSYQIGNFFNEQDRLLDVDKFNTDEMVSNYNILWQFDVQDQNTLDDQEGRVFQAITTPNNIQEEDLVLMKGLAQISLPFTLGKTKTELTDVERLAKTLGSIVDGVTGIFGNGTNFASQIQNRVGSLLLSSHFLTFGKNVKMSGSKLSPNQRTLLSARSIWEKYHFINSFAEVNGVHNQWKRYLQQRVPMSIEEFEILLENNFTTDSEGRDVMIENVIYNPHQTTAVIDYRIREKYTNNLKIQIIE